MVLAHPLLKGVGNVCWISKTDSDSGKSEHFLGSELCGWRTGTKRFDRERRRSRGIREERQERLRDRIGPKAEEAGSRQLPDGRKERPFGRRVHHRLGNEVEAHGRNQSAFREVGSTEEKAEQSEARTENRGKTGVNGLGRTPSSKAGWEPKPESGSQLACFFLMRIEIERACCFNTLFRASGFAFSRRAPSQFFRNL
jgi:hypothetical protein